MAESSSQMSELKILVLEHAVLLWRRKWLVLAICWGVCAVGWTAVMVMPRSYESNARVFVDVNGLLTPLLKGMVINSAPGQNEDYLRQTLLSRPNLEKVIVLANLDTGTLSDRGKDALIADIERSASIKEESEKLISISYSGASPSTAQNVVQALVTVFAEAASSSTRIEMEKARKFLDVQIAQYGAQLRAAEQRRADFDKKYADYLPDPTSGAPRVQVLQGQVQQAQQDYNRALITRDSLLAQVKAAPELLSVDSAPVAGANGALLAASPRARLVQARSTLAELKLQYTDKHPDVIAAQRDVTELEAQVKAGGQEGTTQISNPVYEQIRLKLVDAQTALPAAKEQLDNVTAQLERVKAMASQIPEIEAKSKDIDRDYDVIKANYDELVKRRESATLSQAADDQADRTQFRVVDPPNMPLHPSFPNFPIAFSFVLALGLGAGAAVPLGLSYLQPTFSSMTRLREMGLPVIGSVTIVRRPLANATLMSRPLTVVVSSAVLILLYGALMAAGLHR